MQVLEDTLNSHTIRDRSGLKKLISARLQEDETVEQRKRTIAQALTEGSYLGGEG